MEVLGMFVRKAELLYYEEKVSWKWLPRGNGAG